MSKPKVLVLTEHLHPDAMAMISAHPELFECRIANEKNWNEDLKKAHIFVLRSNLQLNRDDILSAPNLEMIGRPAVGVDNVDLKTAGEKNVLVIHTPEENIASTAELSIGLIIASARKLKLAFQSMSAGQWLRADCLGEELAGSTLSLIGFGRVGKAVARRLTAFDMNIQAVDPYLADDEFQSRGVKRVDFEKALKSSDIISLHVPLTDETFEMFRLAEFKKMKKNCRIINMSRGKVIKEKDLIEALNSQWIEAAALDVFEEEPTKNQDLLQHPKVVSTPHIGSQTTKAKRAVCTGLIERIIEYYQDGKIRNLANEIFLKSVKEGSIK